MTGPGDVWYDDDRLLAELGDAVRSGRAVPDRFVDVGKAAFAWRDIDVELAALRYDSAVSGLPAAVRAGEPGLRALTFEVAGLTVEVELSARMLQGQVVPPQAGSVELWVEASEQRSTVIDEKGWFELGAPPTQPFRLCVRRPGAAAMLTDPVHPA